MNKIKSGFFAITELTDTTAAGHATYNWWHSSDHIPENLALDGIVLGTRWAAPPRFVEARPVVLGDYERHQYLVHYLMTDPLLEVWREFDDLGARTRDLGRYFARREILYADHHQLIKGYVAPGVPISAEAVPFRPVRGVFVVMADAPNSGLPQDLSRWCDEVHIPTVLGVGGVIGAYWFKAAGAMSAYANPAATRHVFVYYLDRDPLAVTADICAATGPWQLGGSLPGSDGLAVVLAGPYESIVDAEHYSWEDR